MHQALYVSLSSDHCRFRAGIVGASATTSAFRVIGPSVRIPYYRPPSDPSPAPQRSPSADDHCRDRLQFQSPRHKRPHHLGRPDAWLEAKYADNVRFAHGAESPRVNLAVGSIIPT